MRRTTGHQIGLGLYASGAAAIASCFTKYIQKKGLGVAMALGGLASFGVGLYLRSCLYLDDPETLAEYRRECENIPLSEAIRKFGLANLTAKIFNYEKEPVRALFEREMGTSPLSLPIHRYGLDTVKALLVGGIVSTADLRERFLREADASGGSFTQLWHLLNKELPKIETALPGVVDDARLRELFAAEFAHVDRGSGAYIGETGRDTAGAPIGLLRAIREYGEYTTRKFSLSREFWRGVIEHSASTRDLSLPELIENGLVRLAQQSTMVAQWIPKSMVAAKFTEYVHATSGTKAAAPLPQNDNRAASSPLNSSRNSSSSSSRHVTLWTAVEEVHLLTLLEHDLIDANVASPLFERALSEMVPLPASSSSSSSSSSMVLTKENHIVEFYKYWQSTFDKYPDLMPSRYALLVRQSWSAAQRALDDRRTALARATQDNTPLPSTTRELDRLRAREAAAEKKKSTAPALTTAEKASITSLRREVRVCEERREEAEKKAHTDYEARMRDLHYNFCAEALKADRHM